jgi:hypothetical protein
MTLKDLKRVVKFVEPPDKHEPTISTLTVGSLVFAVTSCDKQRLTYNAASVIVVENSECNGWQNAGEIQKECRRYGLV